METTLLELASDTESGWDEMVPQLVHVGLTLITADEKGSKCRPVKPFLLEESHIDPSSTILTDHIRAIRLGAKLLRRIFRSHSSAHAEIIDRLVWSIICVEEDTTQSKSKKSASSGLPPAIMLLGDLVSRNPHVFLDHLEAIRNMFDYLHLLPSAHSKALIVGLVPLFNLRVDLRDSLAICLRKAVFSRRTMPRLMAVEGFLVLAGSLGSETEGYEASQSSSARSFSTSLSTSGMVYVRE